MPPFVHRLRVRYHECDQQGIVFNANHFAYFDVVLTELWRAAFGSYGAMVASGTDVQVVDASATFHSPARFDDEIELAMTIARLGTTSITSALEERRESELLVSGRLVHVCVDPATHAKQPIPDSMRERLAPWCAAGGAAGQVRSSVPRGGARPPQRSRGGPV
jgi:acyl-CoA thioester hydrolase